MPLDLDAIRRRWAATPWTNGRSPELAADIAALLAELDRLTAALAAAQAARDALRERAEHAETILTGLLPGPVSDALVDARNHQSRTEGVSAAADWGRTVGRAQVVAAAQAAPVVEWRTVYLDGEKWYAAQPPEVCLLVGPDGWQMWMSVWAWVMKLNPMDSGPETGPVGKAACEAAYRRACGLPAIPPCAG